MAADTPRRVTASRHPERGDRLPSSKGRGTGPSPPYPGGTATGGSPGPCPGQGAECHRRELRQDDGAGQAGADFDLGQPVRPAIQAGGRSAVRHRGRLFHPATLNSGASRRRCAAASRARTRRPAIGRGQLPGQPGPGRGFRNSAGMAAPLPSGRHRPGGSLPGQAGLARFRAGLRRTGPVPRETIPAPTGAQVRTPHGRPPEAGVPAWVSAASWNGSAGRHGRRGHSARSRMAASCSTDGAAAESQP